MEEQEKNNLEFWESVEKTDPTKTKPAKIGQMSITAINATTQFKAATDKWGQYGDAWGLQDVEYSYMDIGETKLAIIKAYFFYTTVRGIKVNFPIGSCLKIAYMTNGASGYLKIDDDFCKKLETDVTTKALSKLGFNADVFMGLYDDNRYVAAMQEEFHPTPKPKKDKMDTVKFTNALKSIIDGKYTVAKLIAKFDLTEEQQTEVDKIDKDGND